MKAVTYQGKQSIAVKEVDDPKILDPQDVIVKITSTAICGSDLHLYQGNFPLPIGYVIGHEPMGIVEEVGPEVTKVKKGDTVIVLGCGPVGLMAQQFAWQKGAERVIAVDYFDYRLKASKKLNHTEIFDFTQYDDMGETLKELTKGGADVVIDCVGMDGKKSPLEN